MFLFTTDEELFNKEELNKMQLSLEAEYNRKIKLESKKINSMNSHEFESYINEMRLESNKSTLQTIINLIAILNSSLSDKYISDLFKRRASLCDILSNAITNSTMINIIMQNSPDLRSIQLPDYKIIEIMKYVFIDQNIKNPQDENNDVNNTMRSYGKLFKLLSDTQRHFSSYRVVNKVINYITSKSTKKEFAKTHYCNYDMLPDRYLNSVVEHCKELDLSIVKKYESYIFSSYTLTDKVIKKVNLLHAGEINYFINKLNLCFPTLLNTALHRFINKKFITSNLLIINHGNIIDYYTFRSLLKKSKDWDYRTLIDLSINLNSHYWDFIVKELNTLNHQLTDDELNSLQVINDLKIYNCS